MLKVLYNKFVRRPVVRKRVSKVGKNFRIGHSSTIKPCSSFSFGDDFFSGPYGYFSSNEATAVVVGSSVMFGPFCKVIAGNHNASWPHGHMMYAPHCSEDLGICVEDGVWLGASVTLLDGAFVCEGAVVGAGAIVSGYIPPYCVALGVPAKKFKRRFDDKNLETALAAVSSNYNLRRVLDIYEEYNVGPK